MNLIPGEIMRGDAGARFVAGDLVLPVAGRPGAAVLGVRPQHLSVAASPTPGALPVTVFAREHLGREAVLVLDGPGGQRLRALVEPETLAGVGQRLFATADPARHLLFSPEQGLLS